MHLQEFAREHIARWVQSTICAHRDYQKDQNYIVKDNKIVLVDYSHTGVLQHSMVLGDGLQQFLQIKEGLSIAPESIATNFLSTPRYFKRYGDSIYGLTGTLGNTPTRNFLTEVYGVDTVDIPSYKQREISGNETSCYRCKELTPHLCTDPKDWTQAIIAQALRPIRNGQAVLVLCQSIKQVKTLHGILTERHNPSKVFAYTGESDFNKNQVDSGEIIIATNIAGRGTDLTTSQAVEEKGGLHVSLIFLPGSYRVELQNTGRTARKGKKGSAQLILLTQEDETLARLRTQRDEAERHAIAKAKQDVEEKVGGDDLFLRYCGLEASLFPTMEELEKVNLSQELTAAWEAIEQEKLSDHHLKNLYEAEINTRAEQDIDLGIVSTSAKKHTPAYDSLVRVLIKRYKANNPFQQC